ncbi:MAG: alcohol dehydrogenase catalytic domain-containing protein [Lachnospiraceae bacterium]|nr:alcohol dehydrogenase catalytic domain-containing protein [Lachnospiraceae bacterium]
MKGLVVNEDNKLYLEEKLPIPELGEYDALVKIDCCMICNGTDMGVIQGLVPEIERYPVVLGHEDAGKVVKIGSKVKSYHVGDLVVRAGQNPTEKFASGWGGFAEYGIVKDYSAAKENGVDVPDIELGITQQVCPSDMKPEDASLLITLKETYSALQRIGAAGAKKMVVIGDGPVALAFLSCGRLQGIQEIYICGNHQEKLDIAMKLGASGVYLNKDVEAVKEASTLFHRNIDFCIDTIGTNATITQCMDYIVNDGVIAVYGLKSDGGLNVPLPELRNFTIRYVQWPLPDAEAQAHEPVVNAIMDKTIDTSAFITHRFSVLDYEKGFQAVRDHSALKVVLSF